MATFDIREEDNSEITDIIFADDSGSDGFAQANRIAPYDYNGLSYICIEDCDCLQVVVNTKEHAKNLIKALRKAIELGWIK